MAEPVDAGLKLDGAYAEPAAMVPPPSVPVEAVLLELLELEREVGDLVVVALALRGELILLKQIICYFTVPEINTGKRSPVSSNNCSMANSAAFALSVSKIVSTRNTSAPPSSKPLACS